MQEIKNFLEKLDPNEISNRGKSKFNIALTLTCNLISCHDKLTTQWTYMQNIIRFPTIIFRWIKDHHEVNKKVRTVLKISSEENDNSKNLTSLQIKIKLSKTKGI